MSAVLLISLYFLALTAFLGLDVLGKVPVSLVALVTSALGGLGAIVVVAAYIAANHATTPISHGLAIAAAGLGAVAAGAAMSAVGRLLLPWARKSRPS